MMVDRATLLHLLVWYKPVQGYLLMRRQQLDSRSWVAKRTAEVLERGAQDVPGGFVDVEEVGAWTNVPGGSNTHRLCTNTHGIRLEVVDIALLWQTRQWTLVLVLHGSSICVQKLVCSTFCVTNHARCCVLMWTPAPTTHSPTSLNYR